LLTDQDTETEEDKNKVTLMTIHSSKGLEFKNVYIVGAEEKLFPSELSSFSQNDLEEERRLFYVAMTRAEKKLYISYAGQRYRFGQLKDCSPSRFIKEINPEFVDFYSAFGDIPGLFDQNQNKPYSNSNKNKTNNYKEYKDKTVLIVN